MMMESARAKRINELLPILLILLVALVARTATIHYGTNVDEGEYLMEGLRLSQGHVIYRDTQYNKTPLVAFVSAPFFWLHPTPVLPIRAVMIGFSLWALWALYRLGEELYDRTTGLIAALLLALEPLTAIWSKYLHTSTWAPWFEIGILCSLLLGLRRDSRKLLFAAGLLLGLYALGKQTAIFMVPVIVAGWLFLVDARNVKRFVLDMSIISLGALAVLAPVFCILGLLGALPGMWFDIYASHLLMAEAKYHDYLSRWYEWRSVSDLAPLLWLAPLGSLIAVFWSGRRETLFLWVWWALIVAGNIIIPTHVWRHYYLVCMPPAALLAGLAIASLYRAILKTRGLQAKKAAIAWCGAIALGLIMMANYHKNDWRYPGLTLEDERILARHVLRYNETPYLLSFTNPAFYIWTGKEMPPAYQGERLLVIPYFMTFAGRGYMTHEDLNRTVALWREMPIDFCVMYGRFYQQIFIDEDPLVAPLRKFFEEEFEFHQHFLYRRTYMADLFLFRRK